VANENFPGGVSIFLNPGNGIFPNDPSFIYFAGTNPVSIAVADLNGDGILDLAVANVNSDSVSVLFGNGNGTFRDTIAYVAGGFPISIAAGDFFQHLDGRLDLITADIASNEVAVIENVGALRPGPPGGASPLLGMSSSSAVAGVTAGSKSIAPSDLDDFFTALGAADTRPVFRQSDAQVAFDGWQPALRVRRIQDDDTFSIYF
jgi:hypothetical protein